MNEAQPGLPEPKAFADAAMKAMEGRNWSWLSRTTNINRHTLRYQLVTDPDALKLGTAKRVASALSLPMWGA